MTSCVIWLTSCRPWLVLSQRNEYRDKVIGLEARIAERDSLHGHIDNLTAPY